MGRLLGAVSGLVLLLSSQSCSQTAFPADTSGFTAATDSLIAAYAGADVIVLGEAHGRKPDSDFRIALVRNSKFPETVRVIVLEAPQPELVIAVDEINQALFPERRVQLLVKRLPPAATGTPQRSPWCASTPSPNGTRCSWCLARVMCGVDSAA